MNDQGLYHLGIASRLTFDFSRCSLECNPARAGRKSPARGRVAAFVAFVALRVSLGRSRPWEER
jgi:hypothetical protein